MIYPQWFIGYNRVLEKCRFFRLRKKIKMSDNVKNNLYVVQTSEKIIQCCFYFPRNLCQLQITVIELKLKTTQNTNLFIPVVYETYEFWIDANKKHGTCVSWPTEFHSVAKSEFKRKIIEEK